MSPPRTPVRVFVADDHPVFRTAVVAAITSCPELEFVGAVPDARSALAAIRADAPDVAVVDVRMALLDGLGVLEALRRDELPTRVLLLTAEVDAAMAYAAVGAGAAGCLLKDAAADRLCEAIIAVGHGETVVAPQVRGAARQPTGAPVVPEKPLLTDRELEILILVADGLSAPAIASRFVLSPATVRTHLHHVYDKLGVSDRAAAVATAMRRGIIE
jgi:two-component system nitrate/nitrite response regulator NarL